jgi:hypothetical protein
MEPGAKKKRAMQKIRAFCKRVETEVSCEEVKKRKNSWAHHKKMWLFFRPSGFFFPSLVGWFDFLYRVFGR